MMTIFNMLGASFTLVLLLMVALWVVYLFQRNAGIVDLGWGTGFVLAAWAYFFLGEGNFLKSLVMATMVTIWGLRLTGYLLYRYNSQVEDPRYTRIRSQWQGVPTSVLFLTLFVFQGVLVILLSMPFFIVSLNSTEVWSQWEFWGVAIWALGVIGEAWADFQLKTFRDNPANAGKVCRAGWWRFSRHPNYFFEILVWIGFCLFALPTQWGWIAVSAPVIMAVLLLRVTGIPATEEQSLVSKGDEYRHYQEDTSPIIPWFPKR